jgi:hypothetical protein
VIQSVLHLHECADPVPAESVATDGPDLAKSTATETTTEPLYSVAHHAADSAAASTAPTKTS